MQIGVAGLGAMGGNVALRLMDVGHQVTVWNRSPEKVKPLADAGAKIALAGRNADRVRALAKICNAEVLLREQITSRHFDAVVHATPLGMFPHVNECFFNGNIPADVVFDMVYNPLETTLIRHAKEQGKTVIPGLEMFIEQAIAQFELWTGETAPRAVMRNAAIEALNNQK